METKELIKNIALNLKSLRKKAGLTQEELIDKIGEENLSLRSYKTYENKNSSRVPLLEKLVIIADFYKCSLDKLIFNKDSIYNDSFSKQDSLKRLSLLIYSLVLTPVKETDPENKYYGKYYFLSYDNEVPLLMDKFETKSHEKNNLFEYYGVGDIISVSDYFNLINEIPFNSEDWEPTLERFNKHLIEAGIEPDEYYENHINRIERRRRQKK